MEEEVIPVAVEEDFRVAAVGVTRAAAVGDTRAVVAVVIFQTCRRVKLFAQ